MKNLQRALLKHSNFRYLGDQPESFEVALQERDGPSRHCVERVDSGPGKFDLSLVVLGRFENLKLRQEAGG